MKSYSKVQQSADQSEWEKASAFSKWSFSVVTPLIKLGEKKSLNLDDLLKLPAHDNSNRLVSNLELEYRSISSHFGIPKLMMAMWKANICEFTTIALLTLLEGLLRLACTVLLKYFLEDLQNENSPTKNIYILAAIISVVNITQSVIHHILFKMSMLMGNNMKIAVIGTIFDRLFRIKGSVLDSSSFGSGKLVNIISNDVQRFEEGAVFVNFLWEALVEVFLILLILTWQMNFLSGLAAVGFSLFILPIQTQISQQFIIMRRETARSTDKRVRHMSEIINGIASVKSYGWEVPFSEMIIGIRSLELQNILIAQRYKAINYCLYFCSPHVAAFATFMVFIKTGGHLTLPLVFTTLAYLQILRLIIGRFFTRAVETFSECITSSQRIESFLDLSDKPPISLITSSVTLNSNLEEKPIYNGPDGNSQPLLEIKNGCFHYGAAKSNPVLKNINFSAQSGEIIIIVGPVGAGKSSILSAILGDLSSAGNDASIRWHDGVKPSIAYCTQRPWIVATTVKANIVMAGQIHPTTTTTTAKGRQQASPCQLQVLEISTVELEDDGKGISAGGFEGTEEESEDQGDYKSPAFVNTELYQESISICKLTEDINSWPDSDSTEIGERGVSVSGGQKARIALARALYSDCALYLLDDPLSAVDANVGNDLFNGCIMNTLKRKYGKTILLVTHQLQHMKQADKILVLNGEGEQTFFGTHDELMSQRESFPYLEFEKEEENLELEDGGEGSKSRSRDISIASSGTKSRGNSIDSTNKNKVLKAKEQPSTFIISAEDRATGVVTWKTYFDYMRSGGVALGSSALLYGVVGQLLSMVADYWLRWWASEQFGPQDQTMYQWVFGLLVFLTIVVGYHKVDMWFLFTNIASRELHLRCLWGVLHSPMSFFIANPTGRILNRFTKDQNQVDEMFPSTFFDCYQCILFCLSSIALVCAAVPWMLIVMAVLAYIFFLYRNIYLKSSLEVKRIEAITRSPLFADFSATLDGLSTLRAFNLESRIMHSYRNSLNMNARAYFSFLMTARWVGFRLDMISSIILVVLVFFAAGLKGRIDVGLLGFALVYTLSLAGLFQWAVRQSAEVENQMTSVERINTYSSLPPEEGYESQFDDIYGGGAHKHRESKKATAEEGKLELRNLVVSYRTDLAPVLRGLNLVIPSGCKVGICGRTGCGKSSLLQALLRLNVICDGDIVVNEKSLLSMSLEEARQTVSLIPQDAVLFSGTIRFNLDPFDQHSDQEIWNALRDAQMFEFFSSNTAGLSFVVEENGKNFSVGQRQLISLARAIVRKGQIVLMDEVTASIDYATDKAIQDTIRTSDALKHSTIITVAHRLRTIADSDLIGYIQDGSFVEVGRPFDLLQQKYSNFRTLAEESNDFDDIMAIAKVKVGIIDKNYSSA